MQVAKWGVNNKRTFDDANMAWPPRISIEENILCPMLNPNQESPIRKRSRKIRELKKISPTRKDLLSQGTNINLMLL